MHTTAIVLPWPYCASALSSQRVVNQGHINPFGEVCNKTVVFINLLEKALFVFRQLSSETMAKLVAV